ncbi:sucrase ferredoxin [Kutzneria viridogrisea]|uniref:Sucrase ferredoxin n=1 Tax=Kutzneria viridogrisea TaxID=47990 RepID=A0ABR6BCT7_9PSEU|nr:hypothetical protein [Kutzneria viridogrisea]
MGELTGTCSALSQALSEPQAGTAAVASTWLCLEQPGPWGAEALHESRLDSGLAAELAARAKGTGVRIALIRRPGGRGEREDVRQVLLACTLPGASWLERVELSEPKQLLDLDFEAAGNGEPVGFGQRCAEPVLLVCTNGRRDVCCAVRGRPVARDLAEEFPGQVWETTHTGGHRFAPTGVLLPTGYAYGRLDQAAGRRLLVSAAQGVVELADCRGRSAFSRAGQVAELAVRALVGERNPEALDVDSGTVVRHVDGRHWRVHISSRELTPARSTSCGKSAAVPVAFEVEAIERID